MALNGIIDASGLIIPEYANEILQAVPQQSVAMRLMRRLPDMSTRQRYIPVLSSLPSAAFVAGEGEKKHVTSMNFGNLNLYAEEIAAIVVVSENAIADAHYDIWGNVRPRIVEAIGKTFDQAVFFGTNKPQSFPAGIVPGAIAAGKNVALDATKSLYEQLMGETGIIAKVEASGYIPTAHVGSISMKAKLRGAVDENGLPIFGRAVYQNGTTGRTVYELDGNEMVFPANGSWDPAVALMVTGDWNQAVWALRQDISLKVLTESTVTINNEQVNLAERDLVGLRVVFRAGWLMANPLNQVDQTANRYPFAVLTPASSASGSDDSGNGEGAGEGTGG